MTEGGSVWDSGPQYPKMWPETADEASSPAAPVDDTPETGSPIDARPPEQAPEQAPVPPPAQPVARKGPRPPGWWQRTLLGFPIWMVLAFVAVVVAVFAVIAMSGDPGSDGAARLQTSESAVTIASRVVLTSTTTAPTTTPPTTTAPTTTVVAATTTVVVTIPTAAPTTVGQTPAVQPTPTSAPTTVATTAAPTTVQANGPAVTIIGRVGPCDYGNECLIAGFTIHNFDSQPTEFVCEFADGSRYAFRFNRQAVERACATGDPRDSITIEVAGVRSATFVHP
jgi:hypothetical protein